MARLARIVIPGLPHQVTQRGNRGQPTFFSDQDYRAYLDLMAAWCGRVGVAIWAYCLMPTYVHLIAVPDAEDGLRRAVGEAHRRYSRRINDRMGWRGHLWQGRFTSFVMDKPNLLSAVRHVELSPVRGGLARRAEAYPWSSASAHIAGRDDRLVRVSPLLDRVGDWRSFLASGLEDGEARRLRLHGSTGRPLGDDAFLDRIEAQIGRGLRRRKPGPKPRGRSED